MAQPRASAFLAGPGVMIFSAVIFGYFGFLGVQWNYNSVVTGQFLLYVAILDWTLKCTAVGFALSAMVTLANRFAGNLVYSIISLLSAVAFMIVAVWDLVDTQHSTFALPFIPGWVLLLAFAAWNGYSAMMSLRLLMHLRKLT